MQIRKVYDLSRALAINIPKPIAKSMGIKYGDYLEFFVVDKYTIAMRVVQSTNERVREDGQTKLITD